MNKTLGKAIEIKLAELALKHSYAYGEEWFSSAKDLEEQLQKIGIKNIKLFHKYKMPGGATQADYMKKIALYCFYVDFEMYNSSDKFGFQTDLKNCIPDDETRLRVIDYIKSKSKSYDEKLSQEYDKIIKLNPDLPNIPTRRDDIIYGSIFGFAPDEIRYFVTDYRGADKEKPGLKEKMMGYGVVPTYVLTPKTTEKIIAALEKNRNNIKKDIQGRKA